MGNLINSLKKFVANRNTVTILGIIAGIIVLWAFYNYRVNKAIDPVRVPYATAKLSATQQITQEDIEYIEISREFLNNVNIITDANQLIGYFVNVGTSIPEGGLFYQSQVVDGNELPDTIFQNMPEGYTSYQLPVNNETTFGNSIYEGNYIDLYMKARDESGIILIGRLIASIEVLGVKDSQNRNVFDDADNRNSAYLVFQVDEDQFHLLRAAEDISGVEIFPVPRGRYYTENPNETEVDSQELVEYINARSRTAN